ncbi:MAG: hypothetical protein ABIK37_06530 [candidate division WOR-3 bacterium]
MDPARSMLECFALPDLGRLVRRQKLARTAPRTRAEAVRLITRHLDLAEIVDAVRADLGGQSGRMAHRLDSGPARHGAAEVRALGELRLEHDDGAVRLQLSNVRLFLENLWPVLACELAGSRAARSGATVIDEGDYELRGGRLRLKLILAGLLSFRVEFLRIAPQSRQPQYLLEPIA